MIKMAKEYDIDISEIDFEVNQKRMLKQRKKNKIKKVVISIFKYILATIFILFMLFAPAIVEMLI